MGDTLIVTVKPEECLALEALYVRRSGEEIRLAARYPRWGPPGAEALDWQTVRQKFPDAYYKLDVPLVDTWDPPFVPRDESGDRRTVRQRHLQEVRESLERFMDDRVALLMQAVRLKTFVVGEVRVRVARFRAVPEWVYRRAQK